jgi:hypothetical protein
MIFLIKKIKLQIWNKIKFENWYAKIAFEYEKVWNVWDSTFWNLCENIFPKFLKPCPGLLKNNLKIN